MSIASLRRIHPDLPAVVVGEEVAGATEVIRFERRDPGGRWAKVHLNKLSPFKTTLYLDADTRIRGDLSHGFGIIEDGWDLAMVPSTQQRHDLLWHIGDEERGITLEEMEMEPIQLQAGVLYYGSGWAVDLLFNLWRVEWERWGDQDQAALLRAIRHSPLKIWLLGRPYNGGSIVSHLFGKARERCDE